MKVKFLIILPLILTVGIILGHLMQVLANPGVVTNPGHSVDQLGAGTFAEQGTYHFPGTSQVGIGQVPGSYKLNVNGNIWTTGIDVVGNALITNELVFSRNQDQIRFTAGTDDWWIMSKGSPTDDKAFAVFSPDTDGGSYSGWNFYVKENGDVNVIGTVIMGWGITQVVCGPSATQCVITCPSGKEILSGGCFNAPGGPAVTASFPGGLDGYTPHAWYCRSAAATTITVYAICARVGA